MHQKPQKNYAIITFYYCNDASERSQLLVVFFRIQFRRNLISNIRFKGDRKTTKKRSFHGFLTFFLFFFVQLLPIFSLRHLHESMQDRCCVLLYNNGNFNHDQNSLLRAPESRDCKPTTQRDELSSYVHHRPMWHQRNPRHREDSRMLMLCCFDSCSISDKSAECPPFCWCGCCCSPAMTEKIFGKIEKFDMIWRVLSFRNVVIMILCKKKCINYEPSGGCVSRQEILASCYKKEWKFRSFAASSHPDDK